MKSCLVTGFGRSGTSLMGGILHDAGYFLGNNLYPPRKSNPKGFFENELINGINECILENYDYNLFHKSGYHKDQLCSPFQPLKGQRWLTFILPETEITCKDEEIKVKITEVTSKPDFAYKDPRFNYTLSIWNSFLSNDVKIICVFRQPGVVVDSVLKDCLSADYLSGFYINNWIIFELWYNSYSHLLKNLNGISKDRIIFVHYEQILSSESLPAISEMLNTKLDVGFISPDLNRSRSLYAMPDKVLNLYLHLCDLASFSHHMDYEQLLQ